MGGEGHVELGRLSYLQPTRPTRGLDPTQGLQFGVLDAVISEEASGFKAETFCDGTC